MRLRADFWVSAYLRRCDVEGISAVLRRRGAPEAGAICVKLDRLDGRAAVFSQAPSSGSPTGERIFMRMHKDEWLDPLDAESRLTRALSFDADLWIVEVESREGQTFLDVSD